MVHVLHQCINALFASLNSSHIQPRRCVSLLHGHVLGGAGLCRAAGPGNEEQDPGGNFEGSQKQVNPSSLVLVLPETCV